MREYVDPSTGEVFALVSLGQWQELVARARNLDPDGGGGNGQCACPCCAAARSILSIDGEG